MAEGVEFVFFEGGGDGLVGRGGGFGQREAFVVDEGAVTCIFAPHAVHAAAVAAQHIALVLDGAGLDKGCPSLVAAPRPVGANKQKVVI